MASEGERRAHNRRLAITLAKAGLYVFPSSGKTPLVLAWQRADDAIGTDGIAEIKAEARAKAERDGRTFDESTFVGATKDVGTVRRMFDKHPSAVPSISLGPSKLACLDCDIDKSRHGPTLARAWLAKQGVDIAMCPVTISQSGGQHIFFSGEAPSRVPPTFKTMYVQAKGLGGQVIAPGARREDGKVYKADPNQPPLASAYGMGALPPIPSCITTLLVEKRDGATDAETDALATRLRTAELPEPLNASRFVSDDKGGDKSAWRLSLANRIIAEGHTVEEYLATLREADHAGAFVGDAAPGEGEYGLRNVARDWGQAERRLAENVAEASRIEAAVSAAFGDVSDTLEAAALAVETALNGKDDPGAEIERLKAALDTDDNATSTDVKAVYEIETAYMLGLDLLEPIARLRGIAERPAATTEPRTGRGYKAESALFADIELTAWTIDEILPERGIGFIVGASHTGKTFACLDMMGHLAQGRDWFGRKVYEPTCSLYIGGEDVEEIPGRIKGWTQRNGSTRDRLGVMDAPPNLAADPKAIKKVVQVVRHLKEDTGLRCGLIVLDTVASLAVGMNENTAEEVGLLTDLMRRIAKATGAAVLGVHHPRKGADSSEGRGSGAFYNNATFEFRLMKKKGARRGSFQVHKNKFAALDTAGLPFQLDPETIGTNRHGKLVTTLVFRQADACDFPAVVDEEGDEAEGVSPEEREPAQALRGQDRVLAAAKRAIAAHGGPVKRATIAAEIEADGGAPLSGNSVGPLIARLVDEGALVSGGRQRYGVP